MITAKGAMLTGAYGYNYTKIGLGEQAYPKGLPGLVIKPGLDGSLVRATACRHSAGVLSRA